MTLTFFHSLFSLPLSSLFAGLPSFPILSILCHCYTFIISSPRTYNAPVKVSSPPLSLSLTSPYYLHSAPLSQASQFYHTGTTTDHAISHYEGSVNISNPLCINSTFDCSKHDYTDSLYSAGPENNTFLFCKQENGLNGSMDSQYRHCYHTDSFLDSLYVCGHEPGSAKNSFCPVYNNEVDSIRNDGSFYRDSRYSRNPLKLFTDPEPPTDINTLTEGDITPYKNIDMQTYITMRNLKNKSNANKSGYKDADSLFDLNSNNINDSKPTNNPFFDSSEPTKQDKLLSFPAYYLYNPKNCPLHKGAPPRLSPVGAISPPHRSGPPVPGTDVARLCSPLFPRSHTIPALAAPLYYPYLYTPPVEAPVREPPVPILHSLQSPPPLTFSKRSAHSHFSHFVLHFFPPFFDSKAPCLFADVSHFYLVYIIALSVFVKM